MAAVECEAGKAGKAGKAGWSAALILRASQASHQLMIAGRACGCSIAIPRDSMMRQGLLRAGSLRATRGLSTAAAVTCANAGTGSRLSSAAAGRGLRQLGATSTRAVAAVDVQSIHRCWLSSEAAGPAHRGYTTAPGTGRAAGGATEHRTHGCGTLTAADAGKSVVLCGWVQHVRNLGGVMFLTVRDGTGVIQIKVDDGTDAIRVLETLPRESVVKCRGTVAARPDTMVNTAMATGAVEVLLNNLEVLNKAEGVPLAVLDGTVGEEARLAARHIDLRRPAMRRNLLVRSEVTLAVRKHLIESGFWDIETPTLFRSTPEGAREFLVPTRQPGKFYALTQSPQQYKQLLMMGSIDRYFQIARCYRDEGGRADRQPEFTQIDIEMSFIDREDVMQVTESLMRAVWQAVIDLRPLEKHYPALPAFEPVKFPLPRMHHKDAMQLYGSDKPDRRFGLEIQEVTDVLKHAEFEPFAQARSAPNTRIQAVRVAGLGGLSRKEMGELQTTLEAAAAHAVSGLVLCQVGTDGAWRGAAAKKVSAELVSRTNAQLGAVSGDLLVIAAGPALRPNVGLGVLRKILAEAQVKHKVVDGSAWAPHVIDMLWVVNFPLFEEEDGVFKCSHHPFTAAVAEDEHILSLPNVTREQLLTVRGQHYDLVCNGFELGGGSIRIHKAPVQRFVMEELLKLPAAQVQGFSHLLTALSNGAPPHGGIAIGLDRLLCLLCNASSLREVLAFPKSATGQELLTGAPSAALPGQLAEYHIRSTSAV